jgi:hypothetical protein
MSNKRKAVDEWFDEVELEIEAEQVVAKLCRVAEANGFIAAKDESGLWHLMHVEGHKMIRHDQGFADDMLFLLVGHDAFNLP